MARDCFITLNFGPWPWPSSEGPYIFNTNNTPSMAQAGTPPASPPRASSPQLVALGLPAATTAAAALVPTSAANLMPQTLTGLSPKERSLVRTSVLAANTALGRAPSDIVRIGNYLHIATSFVDLMKREARYQNLQYDVELMDLFHNKTLGSHVKTNLTAAETLLTELLGDALLARMPVAQEARIRRTTGSTLWSETLKGCGATSFQSVHYAMMTSDLREGLSPEVMLQLNNLANRNLDLSSPTILEDIIGREEARRELDISGGRQAPTALEDISSLNQELILAMDRHPQLRGDSWLASQLDALRKNCPQVPTRQDHHEFRGDCIRAIHDRLRRMQSNSTAQSFVTLTAPRNNPGGKKGQGNNDGRRPTQYTKSQGSSTQPTSSSSAQSSTTSTYPTPQQPYRFPAPPPPPPMSTLVPSTLGPSASQADGNGGNGGKGGRGGRGGRGNQGGAPRPQGSGPKPPANAEIPNDLGAFCTHCLFLGHDGHHCKNKFNPNYVCPICDDGSKHLPGMCTKSDNDQKLEFARNRASEKAAGGVQRTAQAYCAFHRICINLGGQLVDTETYGQDYSILVQNPATHYPLVAGADVGPPMLASPGSAVCATSPELPPSLDLRSNQELELYAVAYKAQAMQGQNQTVRVRLHKDPGAFVAPSLDDGADPDKFYVGSASSDSVCNATELFHSLVLFDVPEFIKAGGGWVKALGVGTIYLWVLNDASLQPVLLVLESALYAPDMPVNLMPVLKSRGAGVRGAPPAPDGRERVHIYLDHRWQPHLTIFKDADDVAKNAVGLRVVKATRKPSQPPQPTTGPAPIATAFLSRSFAKSMASGVSFESLRASGLAAQGETSLE